MLTHHGSPVRNTDLCARFCTQNRGTSLKSLIAYAQQAGLQARPRDAPIKSRALLQKTLPAFLRNSHGAQHQRA